MYSNDWQRKVLEFHEAMGIPRGNGPAIRRGELRNRLLDEECAETIEAIKQGDIVGAIDGLCDLVYVALGTAIEFGIDLDPFFAEVHRSNMEKLGGSVREDGKILKPTGWQPPRIAEMLNEQDKSDRLRNLHEEMKWLTR